MLAKNFLKTFIINKEVNCIIKSIDLYNREVAICYADGIDINQQLVHQGWAIAYKQYSKKYVIDEQRAKKNFLGIWNSAFMEPEQWRRYNKFKIKEMKYKKQN